MRTIYKYPISRLGGSFETFMGYVPRHVGVDDQGQLCLWLEVDTSVAPGRAEVKVVATGQEIDFYEYGNSFEFVGTVIESNGLVWHVYLR